MQKSALISLYLNSEEQNHTREVRKMEKIDWCFLYIIYEG